VRGILRFVQDDEDFVRIPDNFFVRMTVVHEKISGKGFGEDQDHAKGKA